MRVLLNDPPRADHGEKGFVDLRTLACECDIITFHTPLERSGKYQTYHLANESFFNQLEPAFSSATGIEVYHNYTLLHDDLMDRADKRRGKETVHN